jgi:hypothetical protein
MKQNITLDGGMLENAPEQVRDVLAVKHLYTRFMTKAVRSSACGIAPANFVTAETVPTLRGRRSCGDMD